MDDKTMDSSQRLKRFCLTAALIACASVAQVQCYPTKPIRMIVPWPVGGNIGSAF